MIQGKINTQLICPKCEREQNGFIGVGEETPQDNDISLCFYCKSINKYTNNLTKLVTLTEKDLIDFKLEYPEIWEQIQLVLNK